MKVDWTNAEWADGPKFVAWLADKGLHIGEHEAGGKPLARRIRAWATGEEDASFYLVDRVLVHFGRHVSEVPDDIWLEQRRNFGRRRGPVDAEVRVAALRMYEGGATAKDVSRRFGVDPRSLRVWAARGGLGVAEQRVRERAEKRAEALRLLDEGTPVCKVAEAVGLHRRTIYTLRQDAARKAAA